MAAAVTAIFAMELQRAWTVVNLVRTRCRCSSGGETVISSASEKSASAHSGALIISVRIATHAVISALHCEYSLPCAHSVH